MGPGGVRSGVRHRAARALRAAGAQGVRRGEDRLNGCRGHRVLSPSGDVDLASAPALREDLVEATASDATLVVVDLGKVDFLDSVGLSVLVGAHNRLRHDGRRLHLVATTPAVRRVITLTRIDSVIPTYDDVATAEAGCPLDHP